MTRPTWDEYFLAVAKTVSLRADCRRRRVGSVLVSSDNRILATGYNGSPRGDSRSCLEGACLRGRSSYEDIPMYTDYDNCIAIHAEENCLRFFDRLTLDDLTLDPRTCTLYISEAPCRDCRTLISCYDIGKVVFPSPEGLVSEYHPVNVG